MRDYVTELQLAEHPEGGYYRQVFKSEEKVTRGDVERSALTAIYFFLAASQHSAWHRVTSDEIWVHLDGAPLKLWVNESAIVLNNTVRMHAVPAGTWQAAEPEGDVLVACFVAPGFEFDDFTMMRDDPAAREWLESNAPQLQHLL
jgi:predicted cupin superfamily sugar epimerase